MLGIIFSTILQLNDVLSPFQVMDSKSNIRDFLKMSSSQINIGQKSSKDETSNSRAASRAASKAASRAASRLSVYQDQAQKLANDELLRGVVDVSFQKLIFYASYYIVLDVLNLWILLYDFF